MLKRLNAAALLLCLPASLPQGQPVTQQNKSASTQQKCQQASQTIGAEAPALTVFGLEDGTPIKLRLTRNLSSATDRKGDTVDFEVMEDVKVNNILVAPRGGVAWATITEAQPKRSMGRGGKLDVNIDSLRLTDGEKVPLRAVKENEGGGHVGAMTGAMVATAVVFFPAAPLFLLMHGKDINIPKGTEITAYVAGNIPLDKTKFESESPQATNSTGFQAALSQATVSISSVPAGAEVEVDGKFVGNTPSSLVLAAGDHTIKVSKKGYKSWQRTLTASTGSVNLTAELEADK